MKKMIGFITMLLLLSGCSNVFEEEMEKGDKALKEKNYEKAIVHYEKAAKEEEKNPSVKKKIQQVKTEKTNVEMKTVETYFKNIQKKKSESAYSLFSKKMKEKIKKEDYYNYQAIASGTSEIVSIKVEKTKKQSLYKVTLVSKKRGSKANEKPSVIEIEVKKENKKYVIDHQSFMENFVLSYSAAYVEFGNLYTGTIEENYKIANKMYGKAIELNSENVWAMHSYAYSYIKMGEYEKGESAYEETIAKAGALGYENSYLSSLHTELSNVQFYIKRYEDSKNNAEKALKLNKNNKEARDILNKLKKAK